MSHSSTRWRDDERSGRHVLAASGIGPVVVADLRRGPSCRPDGGRPSRLASGQVADEGHVAARFRETAPDRVEVWEVDGAGHTQGDEVDPEAWRRRVTMFLDRHLGA